MTGKAAAIAILVIAVIAGGAMYWLQVYAFYRMLAPEEVALQAVGREGGPLPLAASNIEAITADSSPIRFRACFSVADPAGVIAAARPAADAVPLNAPSWFSCFDAQSLGADLAEGRATAIIGTENIRYGIDRVLVVYPDGRGFAWDQINHCGAEVFDGNPPPVGCPLPPEASLGEA